jgi:hypothetical protein
MEHLQITAASDYNAVTDLCTGLFTTTQAKSSQFAMSSPVIAWQ